MRCPPNAQRARLRESPFFSAARPVVNARMLAWPRPLRRIVNASERRIDADNFPAHTRCYMPNDPTFESFEKELNRLVESFGKRLAELKQPGYAEAQLRDDFLNPFFRALGWDMENRAGFIQKEREVEIESATQIGGGRKRADYLFRTDKRDRFVCEAKKPAEELHARYAFQAKRYAWNKGVPVALLTDFEELKIYIVGGKPHLDEPHVGEWKSWHFRQYPLIARELWDLLARDKIAAGSIDAGAGCAAQESHRHRQGPPAMAHQARPHPCVGHRFSGISGRDAARTCFRHLQKQRPRRTARRQQAHRSLPARH